MFNLIFEELMVSVLSHRWDTQPILRTDRDSQCEWHVCSQGMGRALLTAPWSQESQTWFEARLLRLRLGRSSRAESTSQAEAVCVTTPGNTSCVIVEWDLNCPLKTSILMADISNSFCIIQPLPTAESHHPEWVLQWKAVVVKHLE